MRRHREKHSDTAPNQNIDKDWFLEHHIMMHRIRAFEETAARANQDKLVLGLSLSIGQEAIASGVCKNLMKEDFLLVRTEATGIL